MPFTFQDVCRDLGIYEELTEPVLVVEIIEEEEADDEGLSMFLEHRHYCDMCGANWIHEEGECFDGGDAYCPEHEGGE